MAMSDTSAATDRLRAAVFRQMTPAQKAALVEEMSEDARELARCGIRQRHPGYSPADIEHALHRLLVGDELADKAWPAFTHLQP